MQPIRNLLQNAWQSVTAACYSSPAVAGNGVANSSAAFISFADTLAAASYLSLASAMLTALAGCGGCLEASV